MVQRRAFAALEQAGRTSCSTNIVLLQLPGFSLRVGVLMTSQHDLSMRSSYLSQDSGASQSPRAHTSEPFKVRDHRKGPCNFP